MRKKKSKIIMIGYVTLACAAVLCGTTLAYFIYHDSATNTFVVGSQVSEISEVWDPPDSFTKGGTYTKQVAVKNTGTSNCYVRVFAEIADDIAADSVSVDWNTSDWTKRQADGYYYYKTALSPGEKTVPLFTTLTATADLSDFDMIVYEESVQAAGAESPQQAFEF